MTSIWYYVNLCSHHCKQSSTCHNRRNYEHLLIIPQHEKNCIQCYPDASVDNITWHKTVNFNELLKKVYFLTIFIHKKIIVIVYVRKWKKMISRNVEVQPIMLSTKEKGFLFHFFSIYDSGLFLNFPILFLPKKFVQVQ